METPQDLENKVTQDAKKINELLCSVLSAMGDAGVACIETDTEELFIKIQIKEQKPKLII